MSAEAPSYLECALITGASSGLGREFALQLAPICEQIVIVARRKDRLVELAKTLTAENSSLQVTPIVSDLSVEQERDALIEFTLKRHIHPTLLVNNAGLGDYGEFAASDWDKIKSMMEVNMVALTHLTYAFLPKMKKSGLGAILNVSSIAGLVPIPDFAVYAATKAYVTSFGEALRTELAEDKIPVLTVCPGPVHTEFGEVAARGEEKFKAKGYEHLYVDSSTVVTESLNALFQNHPRIYPGWKVAVFATLLAALPLFAVRYINSKRPRRMIDDNYERES